MFDEHFPPYCASTVSRWTPTWSKQTDPSGRFVSFSLPLPASYLIFMLISLPRAISTHVAKYEQ